MTKQSDLLIEIQFLTSEQGGWRTGPISEGRTLRPILHLDGFPKDENFVCCLYLQDADDEIRLGVRYKMRLDLLSPQVVIPLVSVGSKFELLERGVIAKGQIIWVRELTLKEQET